MWQRSDFALRALREDDRDRILIWRNSDPVRTMMFNEQLIPPERHVMWFRRILSESAGRYRIFEHQNEPVGLVYFPGDPENAARSFWGFYLGEPKRPKGLGQAMGYLALDYAFAVLRLKQVVGRTMVKNLQGLRLHRQLRFKERPCHLRLARDDGEALDVVEFEMNSNNWQSLSQDLATGVFQ